MWAQAQRILFGNPYRTIRTIVLIVGGLHVVYFVLLPLFLTRRKTRSPGLRRYLEFVVATPSLLGDVIRAEARHDLMRLAHMEGRHQQVADQGFAILRHSVIPPGMASEVRSRLADALEGLGRTEEADEQRRLAAANLREAPRDATWFLNRGRQLSAAREYTGACIALESGLRAAPPGPNEVRALITLQLANTLFLAGRLEDAARRAEEAAAMGNIPERLYLAHRQAGAAYASLGRLEEAEAHRRQELELAEAMGDPQRLADSLATLAELERKRGHLAQALAACDRAVAAGRATRHVEMTRFEILRSWGRFDEALATSRTAAELDPLPTPRAERFIQGLFAFVRATVLIEQNRLDDAAQALEAARQGMAGDAKTTLWCDALAVRLAALQGRREPALRGLDDCEQRLAGFQQDRNTRSGVLGNLGRAAVALGLPARAMEYWQTYLDLPALPVDVPTAQYHLGECHRGLGDSAAARAAYRAAVDTGLDTHHARLARNRMRSVLA